MIQSILALALLLPFSISAQSEKYPCGEKRLSSRPYGKVEIRVDCKRFKDRKWVSEYKGETLHGMSLGFRMPSGTKKDSCFFREGKEHGTCLVWDSLGNVVSRLNYKDGKEVGKKELFYSAGRPYIVKQFNEDGRADGPWEEWWPNGKKQAELVAKNGQIISGTEYYPNGRPRVRYVGKYEPGTTSVFKQKYIEGESWAPNGRSIGKISGGQGEWILFPDGKDSTNRSVFREIYKDSVMVKGEKLDSIEVARWTK